MRGRAVALRGAHLSPTDVEELVRQIERRLAIKALAGDGIGSVARAAGGGEVLAARLDGHPEEAPLRRPLQVPRQLGVPAEWADPTGRAAPASPCHVVWEAREGDRLAVPVGGQGGTDAATGRADRMDRQPTGRTLDAAHPKVDLADKLRSIEGGADVSVHLAGRIDLAHPVVAVRVDPDAREGVDEHA